MNTKFTLLVLMALMISFASTAQINKGALALGGNFDLNTTNSKDDAGFKETATSILVSPSLMTFYSNDRAIGLDLSYGYAKNNNLSASKLNSYGAGIFLRQYKPLGKNFYVFAQELLNYTYYKSNGFNDSVPIEDKTNIIALTVNPGIAYNICKRFQLELLFFNNLLSANYSHSTTNDPNASTTKSNNFNIGANLGGSELTTLNIGAKIYFGK